MLQMRARFANIVRTAQPHPADSLGMDPFYTCSLSIQLRKLLGLLTLASRLECQISLTRLHSEGWVKVNKGGEKTTTSMNKGIISKKWGEGRSVKGKNQDHRREQSQQRMLFFS